DVPDLHGEPRERERGGIPVLPRFLLPLRPDLIVALADRDLAVGDLLLEVGVAADPLLAGFDQRRNAERGVAERAHRTGLHAAIVHRPLADADLGKADLDEIARRRRQEFAD